MSRKTPAIHGSILLRLVLPAGLAVVALAILGFAAYANGAVGGPLQTPKAKALATVAAEQTADARAPRNTTKHPTGPINSCPDAVVTPQVLPPGYGPTDFGQIVKNSAVALPVEPIPFYYAIYGGARKANPQQGLIVVMRMDDDPCLPSATGNKLSYYDTPYQDGVVTLTQLQGDSILFTTANGKTGSLNFVTGKFA